MTKQRKSTESEENASPEEPFWNEYEYESDVAEFKDTMTKLSRVKEGQDALRYTLVYEAAELARDIYLLLVAEDTPPRRVVEKTIGLLRAAVRSIHIPTENTDLWELVKMIGDKADNTAKLLAENSSAGKPMAA